MSGPSGVGLVERLQQHGLLSPEQHQEVVGRLPSQFPDPRLLALVPSYLGGVRP